MSPAAQPRGKLSSRRGSALLAVMCFATVLVLALTTFQALCYQTLKTSNRNTQSTHAIELAEMGMEYALWSRSNAIWTTAAGGLGNWTISSSTASLTLSGSDFNYSNGTSNAATGSVTVSITNYNGTNTTTSVATSAGTATLADGSTVTRRLQATLKKAEPFSNAIGATATSGTVQLLTGGQTIDSYSSTVEAAATPTPFPATPTTDYAAVVAGYSVAMYNSATVNGYVATPPNSGNVNLTNTSSSKLKGPSTSATLNIDTTRMSTSAYQSVFDVPNPTVGTVYSQPADATALAAAKVTYGNSAVFALAEPAASTDVNLGETGSTTYYRATLGATSSSYYYLRNNNGRLIIDGTSVVIIVPGYFYIDTNGSIVVKNGGSLRLLIQGNISIYYAGIDNQTKRPKNVSIIGTGTTTVGYTFWVWSYNKLYATIYAPRHAVRIWGSNNSSEFFGSVVGNSVIIDPYNTTTGLKIHYDKDLATEILPDVSTPYTIQSGTLTEL